MRSFSVFWFLLSLSAVCSSLRNCLTWATSVATVSRGVSPSMPSAFISSGVSGLALPGGAGLALRSPEKSLMPTNTSTSAIGISSHFRRVTFHGGHLLRPGRPLPPAAGSPSRRSAPPWAAATRPGRATGDEIDHGGVGCAPAGPRVGCWKVAARKSPCSARGSRSSQRPEVLVSFTAVTHWSSSRHAASACARTGSVGSKVSSARLRRVDAADAGHGLHCAAARTGSAPRSASAPRPSALRGGRLVPGAAHRRPRWPRSWPAAVAGGRHIALDDAHGFEHGLARLGRLGGDVEQDQRAGFHVL